MNICKLLVLTDQVALVEITLNGRSLRISLTLFFYYICQQAPNITHRLEPSRVVTKCILSYPAHPPFI